MSASALNRLLRRRRRRLAALWVVLALSGAVAAHHMATHDGGMGDMGTAAMVICLAVFPAVALLAVAGAVLPRPRFVLVALGAPEAVLSAPPLPRARSSPVVTVVLRR